MTANKYYLKDANAQLSTYSQYVNPPGTSLLALHGDPVTILPEGAQVVGCYTLDAEGKLDNVEAWTVTV